MNRNRRHPIHHPQQERAVVARRFFHYIPRAVTPCQVRLNSEQLILAHLVPAFNRNTAIQPLHAYYKIRTFARAPLGSPIQRDTKLCVKFHRDFEFLPGVVFEEPQQQQQEEEHVLIMRLAASRQQNDATSLVVETELKTVLDQFQVLEILRDGFNHVHVVLPYNDETAQLVLDPGHASVHTHHLLNEEERQDLQRRIMEINHHHVGHAAPPEGRDDDQQDDNQNDQDDEDDSQTTQDQDRVIIMDMLDEKVHILNAGVILGALVTFQVLLFMVASFIKYYYWQSTPEHLQQDSSTSPMQDLIDNTKWCLWSLGRP